MTARTRRVRTEMTVDEARAYGAAARAANTPKAARVHDVEAALAAHNNTQIAKRINKSVSTVQRLAKRVNS